MVRNLKVPRKFVKFIFLFALLLNSTGLFQLVVYMYDVYISFWYAQSPEMPQLQNQNHTFPIRSAISNKYRLLPGLGGGGGGVGVVKLPVFRFPPYFCWLPPLCAFFDCEILHNVV